MKRLVFPACLEKHSQQLEKLKLQEFEKWITLELNGYYHLAELELVRPEDRWERTAQIPLGECADLRVRLPNQRSIPWVFESRQRSRTDYQKGQFLTQLEK